MFALGGGSYFVGDLVLARFLSPPDYATWVTFRNVILISVPIILFGLDQVLIRVRSQTRRLVVPLLLQIIIGAFVIEVVARNVLPIDLPPVATVLGIVLWASASAMYAFWRARLCFNFAQISTQGWRILLLLGVLIMFFFLAKKWRAEDVIYTAVLSLVLVLIANAFFLRIYLFGRPSKLRVRGKTTLRVKPKLLRLFLLYRMGAVYAALMVTLAASVYMGQLLLGFVGEKRYLAVYAVHYTMVVMPFTLCAAFPASVLAPFIRRYRHKLHMSTYSLMLTVGALCALLLAGCVLIVSMTLFPRLFGIHYTYRPWLAALLSLIGILRFVYIIPSVFVGMTGKLSQMWRFWQWGAVGIGVELAIFALGYMIGYNILFILAIAEIGNWLLRLFGGVRQSYLIFADEN